MSEMSELLADLAKEIRGRSREAKKLGEALRTAAKEDAPLPELAAAAEVLAGVDDDERWASVSADVNRRVERGRIRATMKLSSALEAAATEAGFSMEKLSDRPLVLGLGSVAVECDVAADTARLLFGREVARADLACVPDKILAARAELLAEHETWSSQSGADLFDRIRRAYEVVLLHQRVGTGERVELVDLLVPLAFLTATPRSWRVQGPAGIEAYPSHRLAWDLHHLRRSGKLEHGGVRLDLGVATGGSTANKHDVLFVPTSPTDGQYYASIRFVS